MGKDEAPFASTIPIRSGRYSSRTMAGIDTRRIGEEYRRRFIELAVPLDNVPEEVSLGNFINGLRPKIRAKLRILEPNNLGRVMDLAQNVEEKLTLGHSQRSTFGS